LRTKWIRKALPFFDPSDRFFVVDPNGFKGFPLIFSFLSISAFFLISSVSKELTVDLVCAELLRQLIMMVKEILWL
jgi:hypothetical protein